MTSRADPGGRLNRVDRLPWLSRLVVPRSDPAAERLRDGRLAGLLYLVAAVYGGLIIIQVPDDRPGQLVLMVLVALIGVGHLATPWHRLPREALHLPMALALLVLSLGYGAALGDLSHWEPAYTLAFGYVGLALGPARGLRWGAVALAGLAVAVLLGRQHEHVLELAAAIGISALLGELIAAAVAVQRRHAGELNRLHSSLAGLLEAEELTDAAALICREAAELLSADGVTVLMAEGPGSSVFVGHGGWGLGSPGYADIRIDIEGEPTATAHAVTTARPLFVPDVARNGLISRRWAERLNAASVLYLPLLGRDEVIGVIPIWWSRPVGSLDSFAEQVTRLLSVQAAPVLERLRRLEDLDKAALTDPLTGVGNRRSFEHALAGLPADAALIICDLDRFKHLNDTLGHAAGDRVLRHFAATAAAAVRSGDLVARIGGDEFALVVHGGRPAADAVLMRMTAQWDSPDGVGFSAGSAVREAGETPAALSERADRSLYEAKRASHRQRL